MTDPLTPTPLNILVVDDEANIRRTLSICLEAGGHRVAGAGCAKDALAESARRPFDLAFVDLRLGAEDGLELIPALLAAAPWMKIIVVTAYASIDSAVEAMKRGASDYDPKPFTPAQIALAVGRVFEMRALEQRVAALQEDLGRGRPEIDFSSASPAMRKAIDQARRVAASEATVLLRGESGTGKTVLARAIHGWSRRSAKPLGIVSCPSFPAELLESELFGHIKGAFTGAVRDNPGRVAACEGGSLFLDEVGDLPPALQPKLLRFLQEKEYERVGDNVTRKADVRLIAATNADLVAAIRAGTFREDLFYRLGGFPIDLPPLRERSEDIAPLAEKLLVFHARNNHRACSGFTGEAIRALTAYPWPGNIRELSNVIERAVILSGAERLGVESLPAAFPPGDASPRIGDPVTLERIEEEHIRRIIAGVPSLQEAARVLGIDQATLWRRRKKYGI